MTPQLTWGTQRMFDAVQAHNQRQTAMPLSMANAGEELLIVEFHGGAGLRKRLADLGLNVGMPVRVVQADASGAIILAVKNDSRLALGRGMAHKIFVTPLVQNR